MTSEQQFNYMTTETADVILLLHIQMHEMDGESGNPS